MILADSTPSKININQIKNNIDRNEEAVIFKRFPGHTADEIGHYVTKPLTDNRPEQVIVIAGTNDLSRDVYAGNTLTEYDIVERILSIARSARSTGAKKIYVSGILVRHGFHYRNIVIRVNRLLEERCREEQFIYMDQSNITSNHISKDGIHPNFYGQTILKRNILECFNTFNPYLSDFDHDYERSLF